METHKVFTQLLTISLQQQQQLIFLPLMFSLIAALPSPSKQQSTIRTDRGSTIDSPEFIDVMATKYKELDCPNIELLGFNNQPYNITWDINEKSSFKVKSHIGREKLVADSPSLADEGNYTCTLTLSNGTQLQKTYIVCVTISDEVDQIPYKGTISPETYAEIGQSVSFECKAYVGAPRCLNPHAYPLQWAKLQENNTLMPLGNSSEEEVLQGMKENGMKYGQLTIKNVRPHHYGIYTCTIENKFGSFQQNVTLTDEVPPAVLKDRQLWGAFFVLVIICFLAPFATYFFRHGKANIELYLQRRKYDPSATEGFSYDVFVVHGPSSSAYSWVMSVLRPTLMQYHYKCFIPSTDILGGEDSMSCITKIVEQSLQVMVIVTPCLLEDPVCRWALLMADNASRTIPICILPLILQKIKKNQDSSDQHRPNTLRILDKLKSNQIQIPRSCQLKHQRGYQNSPLPVAARANKVDKEVEMEKRNKENPEASELVKSPSLAECTVKSKPVFPLIQRLTNMLYAVLQCLRKWTKAFCVGDDPELFWKTLRLHLSPPMDSQEEMKITIIS